MKIFGITGWKNAGKTTLIAGLVREIGARGLKVSTIKHAHHAFDLDRPGKDSYQHRAAGAQEVLIASHDRWALLHELRGKPEPSLKQLLAHMSPADLVLVEGFKNELFDRLEVRRKGIEGPLLAENDSNIVAIVSDMPMTASTRPIFSLDDIPAIADFILRHCNLMSGP